MKISKPLLKKMVSVLLIISIVSCNNGQNKTTPTPTSNVSTTKIEMGELIIKFDDSDFPAKMLDFPGVQYVNVGTTGHRIWSFDLRITYESL